MNNDALSVSPLPELGHTKSLQCYLDKWLGKDYSVYTSNSILTDTTFGYATSKPDLVFYHKDNFIFKKMLTGGMSPMDVDPNDNVTASPLVDKELPTSTLLWRESKQSRRGTGHSNYVTSCNLFGGKGRISF